MNIKVPGGTLVKQFGQANHKVICSNLCQNHYTKHSYKIFDDTVLQSNEQDTYIQGSLLLPVAIIFSLSQYMIKNHELSKVRQINVLPHTGFNMGIIILNKMKFIYLKFGPLWLSILCVYLQITTPSHCLVKR